MNSTEFVYTTYMKSSPEKVWTAITNPEFARQYWGKDLISDWKKGSSWKMAAPGDPDTFNVVGEVLEALPPKRLVLTWSDPAEVHDAAQQSRVTFEIEAVEDMVRLNVIHDKLALGSTMARNISVGWPLVLSNLKSFLETGEPFDIAAYKMSCAKKASLAEATA